MKNGYGSPYIKAFTSLGEITDRITDFSYKFSQKGDDVCQIRIESDDANLPDLPIYQEGVEYTLQWGYIGETEKQNRTIILRNVKVGYTEEGISLDLLFTDKASLIKTNSSKRVHNKKSVKEINEDIANRNGLTSQLLLAAPTGLSTPVPTPGVVLRVYDTLPQANRSDYEVLKEAADNDPNGPFEIVGRDNTITVQKPNYSQAPIRAYKWKGEDGELLQFVPESKEYFAGSGSMGITSTTVDPTTKTFEESTVTEGNNGVEEKIAEQISTPNGDHEDDGPGIISQLAGYVSETIDDIGDMFNQAFSWNNPETPADKKIPIKNDPSVKGKELKTVQNNEGGDKSYNPIKDTGFDTYYKEKFAGRTIRYSKYDTEAQSYVTNTGFNVAQVSTTRTISRKPFIPTYLTSQESPSVENNSKEAAGKQSAVQHTKALEKNPATARVVGNIIIESGKILTIDGISKKFSGNYYILEAVHRMTPGNYYLIDMELARSGTGRIPKPGINTIDTTSKYSKAGNKIKVNTQQGPSTNKPTGKTLSSSPAETPKL